MSESRSQKRTKTKTDTIAFTPAEARSWALPPFQRELRMNEKVRELAERDLVNAIVRQPIRG